MYKATVTSLFVKNVGVTFTEDNVKSKVRYDEVELISDKSNSEEVNEGNVEEVQEVREPRVLYSGTDEVRASEVLNGQRPNHEFKVVRTVRSNTNARYVIRSQCAFTDTRNSVTSLHCPCYRTKVVTESGECVLYCVCLFLSW